MLFHLTGLEYSRLNMKFILYHSTHRLLSICTVSKDVKTNASFQVIITLRVRDRIKIVLINKVTTFHLVTGQKNRKWMK